MGSFFFSRFHRYLTPRRRWVLAASYCIQFLFIAAAAIIVTVGDKAAQGLDWQVIVPLAAVAFQSSGQAVTSRVLNFGGLTTVVLTSNYCDLFSDPKLFAKQNAERNRRALAPVLLLVGAIFGGLWARSSFGMPGALWTAAVLKFAVIMAWVFWSADVEEKD